MNQVGVDLNTASPALLQHVSGLGASLAESIVAHRNANGPFGSRHELLKVKGTQPQDLSAGREFLRIRGGDQPLNNTAIHPRSYQACAAASWSGWASLSVLGPSRHTRRLAAPTAATSPDRPGAGHRPAHPARHGREPAQSLAVIPATSYHRRSFAAICSPWTILTVALVLRGTVRNVVDFGAFVDIGVKQDGLVHIGANG